MIAPDEKPVEIDAATLTPAEWFFLWAANGVKPDAKQADQLEWHKRSLGMSQARKLLVFREGFESLKGRGFIVQERDASGRPVYDNSEPPQPVFKCLGRIVSRVTAVPPTKVPNG